MLRNPIHKRLQHLASWQHIAFMAGLCERMYPNFELFCQVVGQPAPAKVYHNILNLVWEHLTVRNAGINFDRQLEKLENVIPDVNDYDFFGIIPALDACEALSELLHGIIAGSAAEQAVKISQLSLQTVALCLETQRDCELNEQELKDSEAIQRELDAQWRIYRLLNAAEEHSPELILSLKNELRSLGISNIGIENKQQN